MNAMPPIDSPTRPTSNPRYARLFAFVAVYLVLQAGYQSLRAGPFEAVLNLVVVRPAAALIGMLMPADGVVALGARLVWPAQGRLTLLAGCDGFEVMSIFVAAVVAADVGWRRGFVALVFGCVAIWALNQLRIAALYFAFRYRSDWFDALHNIWGPLVLIVAVTAIYVTQVAGWPRTGMRTERGSG